MTNTPLVKPSEKDGVYSENLTSSSAPVGSRGAAMAAKLKLLIVDDEPVIVEFVAKLLVPYASDIRCAYDGQEAVSVARDFHADRIITGVMMPRMDGLQEATEILQFLPNCRFVFMSGS